MPALFSALGLDRLSRAEKMALVREILEDIAASPDDLPLTDAQMSDLRWRLDAIRDDPNAGSPWEDVLERLRGRPSAAVHRQPDRR